MYNGNFNEADQNQSPIQETPITQPLVIPGNPGSSDHMIPAALAARGERFFILGMVALALAFGIVIGTFITRPASADHRIALVNSKGTLNDPSAFASVAQAVRPSVVNITSIEEGPKGLGGFFGGGGGRRTGTGSGVIISKDGYILTNNHVIDGAVKITVRFFDGTEMKGTVIGADSDVDIAVVKVDPKGKALVEAKLGDSDKLDVGDWVLAIGSPFGLEQTVTQGIISAKERVTDGSTLQQFLQTDAAINPGNSGGPLVNLNGEVIGINTQIATRTGTYNGIGFALPSATIVDVYNQLVNEGKVHRGYLGLFPGPVPAVIAHQNSVPEGEGALVRDLTPGGGPAQTAGIQSGDIIVEFNGNKVKDDRDLVRRVAGSPVGTNAVLRFVRDGKSHTVTVKLGERPAPATAQNDLQREPPDEEDVKPSPAPGVANLGLEVETFSARKADQLGLKHVPGVLITNIVSGSPADEAGLRVNTIILRVNNKDVATAEEFKGLLKSFKSGQEVSLQIATRQLRSENLQRDFITLTIP